MEQMNNGAGSSRLAPAPSRYFGLAKAKAYLAALKAEKADRDTVTEADVSGLGKELWAKRVESRDWSCSRPAIQVLDMQLDIAK